MNKSLPALIRAFIVFAIAAFTAVCICFFPSFCTYIKEFFIQKGLGTEQLSALVYTYGAVLVLPCFAVLIMALRFPVAIAQDRIFTNETAALLSRISLILAVDCVLFLFGIIALFALRELTVSPLLSLIDLIGFSLAFLLRVLSDYVKRAAQMKEEVDATL